MTVEFDPALTCNATRASYSCTLEDGHAGCHSGPGVVRWADEVEEAESPACVVDGLAQTEPAGVDERLAAAREEGRKEGDRAGYQRGLAEGKAEEAKAREGNESRAFDCGRQEGVYVGRQDLISEMRAKVKELRDEADIFADEAIGHADRATRKCYERQAKSRYLEACALETFAEQAEEQSSDPAKEGK